MESVSGLSGVRDWTVHRRQYDGIVVATRGHVARSDGLLRLERAVLGDAVTVPDRHGGGGLDRLDQLNRQSGRVFGPWYVGVMKDVTGSYAGRLYGFAPF